jgi:hypothetical protein
MTRSSRDSHSSRRLHGSKGTRVPVHGDARLRLGQRLDLQPVDADHGMAVVHQVVREREAGGPEADHQHLAPCRGAGAAAQLSGFQRVSSE